MYKLITSPVNPPTEVMALHTVENVQVEHGNSPHEAIHGVIRFTVMPWHEGEPMGLRDSFRAKPHPDGQEAAIRDCLIANGFQEAP